MASGAGSLLLRLRLRIRYKVVVAVFPRDLARSSAVKQRVIGNLHHGDAVGNTAAGVGDAATSSLERSQTQAVRPPGTLGNRAVLVNNPHLPFLSVKTRSKALSPCACIRP